MGEKKVAVLGLDGAPYSMLKDLVDLGIMPSLKKVVSSATFMPMETSLPPVSAVAWTSFMTGANPGRHGIFGFTDVKENSRSLHLPSFDDLKAPAIWSQLPHKRSIVVNLPFTYPARPLSGILIAGFVAPIFERSVYPDSLLPWLKSRNYRVDVDSVRGRDNRNAFIEDLFQTLAVHETTMLELMQSPWDLFIGVITGTDRLHHFFYDAFKHADHPYHERFIEDHARVNLFIERFLDRLPSDTRLIMLSDHGFTELKTQVYLNNILGKLGYLSFLKPDPQRLEDIHPNSKAFAMDPGRIYLNSRRRFKDGALSEAEAQETMLKLKLLLEDLRLKDLGLSSLPDMAADEKLFQSVERKEAIYEGPCIDYAPDLVIIPSSGIDLKASLNARQVAWRDIFAGTHTHDNAFLIVDNPPVQGEFHTGSHRGCAVDP